jgi:hypothetical protein
MHYQVPTFVSTIEARREAKANFVDSNMRRLAWKKAYRTIGSALHVPEHHIRSLEQGISAVIEVLPGVPPGSHIFPGPPPITLDAIS